jgi:ribosomal protein S18 acetylase RimI-like enzyme
MTRHRNATIKIRPYRTADFDAVTWLCLESFRSTGVGAVMAITFFRRGIREDLAKQYAIHVATERSRVVGFIGFNGDELDTLFVSPARPNRGIGKQLLDFAKAARPNGFWLRTLVQNTGARRFYEREGLRYIKTTLRRRPGYGSAWYEWRPGAASRPCVFSPSLRKQLWR